MEERLEGPLGKLQFHKDSGTLIGPKLGSVGGEIVGTEFPAILVG